MSESASVQDLVHRITTGETTARTAVDAALERIERDQSAGRTHQGDDGAGPVNAVVATRAMAARAEADAVDAACARGEPVGPLAGVPVSVKEAFDVAGMATTWGLPGLAEHRAERDAEVVRRLRAAGAVVVGKTNVATMLSDFAQTSNDVYGRTVNPLDPRRSPGGSSGGAAAAVAAGHSWLDVGSDLAGSIRVPSAWCGVYALKASAGTLPTRGFQPPGPPAAQHALSELLALGPFARHPGDLQIALDILADPRRPRTRPSRLRVDRLRVGVVLDDPTCPCDEPTSQALSETVEALAARGAELRPGWPDGIDPHQVGAAFKALLDAYLGLSDPQAPDPDPDAYAGAVQVKHEVEDAWRAYFGRFDCFLTPAVVTAAIPHDDRPMPERTIVIDNVERSYFDLAHWIAPASLPGLPVVTAPIGMTPGGLPIGIQILTAYGADRQAIEISELLADTTG